MKPSPVLRLEWPVPVIVCEHVDAQVNESCGHCEDKPHISHLLSWDGSLGRLLASPEEAATYRPSD